MLNFPAHLLLYYLWTTDLSRYWCLASKFYSLKYLHQQHSVIVLRFASFIVCCSFLIQEQGLVTLL